MEEFLRYSVSHQKRIKVFLMADDHVIQQNILVLSFTKDDFTYVGPQSKTPRTLPLSALLSAGYARGDSGETQ